MSYDKDYNSDYNSDYASGAADENTYTIKTGGGCLILFGMPFFLAGLAIMSSPFWPHSDAPLPVALFGLVFASVGAAFVFGRAGMSIDKSAGTITKWWGIFGFKKKTVYEVEGATHVWISKETRTSHSKNGSNTYTVYPVRVELETKNVDIEEPRRYEDARKRLEEIAKFLGLGTKDTTGGKAIIRKADTLDMSVKERLAAEGIKPSYPEAPTDLSVDITTRGHEAELTIPPAGMACQSVFGFLFGLVFGLMPIFVGAAIMFDGDNDMEGVPLPVQIIIGIVILVWSLGGLSIAAYSILLAKRRDVVLVSPEGVTLRRKGLLGYKGKTINARQIEEVEIAQPEHNEKGLAKSALLSVRSDDLVFKFGYALEKSELNWMKDLITYILVS